MLSKSMSLSPDSQWDHLLSFEFKKPYMNALRKFLQAEVKNGKTIFPHSSEYFAALNQTTWDEVKVVIIGQDPYHNEGQAHGFCFSVRPQVPIPPSLKNIFKEIERDLEIKKPSHGCLLAWADRGVLLLNATLTVEAHKAGSHQQKGWEVFTDKIITLLNEKKENLVFLLWGAFAAQKGNFIDREKHLVLEAPHPSPLSAHRGFSGCGHFQKTNQYLKSIGKEPIDWSLPEF